MRKFIAPLFLLLLVVIVFKTWFLSDVISAFDFPYFSKTMMSEASILQFAWGYHPGLGGHAKFLSPYSWVFPIIYSPQAIFRDLLDWSTIARISYLFPILTLSIISPIIFFRKLFPESKLYLISVLVYSFNTFALLLFSGQVFLSISYVLFPLIFYLFIEILGGKRQTFNSLLLGFVISLSFMADPRLAYIEIFSLALYFVYSLLVRTIALNKQLFMFCIFIPLMIILFSQSFWLIPTVLYGANPVEKLGTAFSTQTAVDYLSFAKLENSISLLHPNWPENIFGKTYFMRPEFLILPILAFASLIFLPNIKERKIKFNILFFALVGILGTFLAKGSNAPLGDVYVWLFNNFPGFIMFRDASKWYMLVAISYSVLIPFTIWRVYEWLKSWKKLKNKSKYINAQNLFVIFVIAYLLILIHPALLGQLRGTLKVSTVPNEYLQLEKFLSRQDNFFRTIWLPSTQRFGYYSNLHPQISANNFFNKYSHSEMLEELKVSKSFIDDASIKYVIVPYDNEGEIFLTDRKYDKKKYKSAIVDISKIRWLKKVDCCGRIAVFENSDFKDHFWSASTSLTIDYQFINPTRYKINLQNAKKGDRLVFTESFDSKWVIRASDFTVQSTKFKQRFNSFVLPRGGDYSVEVYYKPQDWVILGSMVSIFSLGTVLILIAYTYKRK